MNKSEYKTYQENVESFFKTEGITNLSTGGEGDCSCCGMDLGDQIEPSFARTPCECCGSSLGGDRHHATGYNPETKEVTCYSVCIDCLYYAEYGQLDDMTMSDMEED